MAKNVFRPVEIVDLTVQKVKVAAPVFDADEPEPVEYYEGPSADDLRREAEAFKESWAGERENIIQTAHAQAEAIKKESEQRAADVIAAKNDEAIANRRLAQDEADELRLKAEKEAERIREESAEEREKIFEEARNAGHTEGHAAGWEEGRKEAERLVERLHKILNAAIEKRREIISGAETQLIELVLLMSRKVVKVISENQKSVVIKNIVQALSKLKNRGDVSIRVNLADLELSTEHVKEFLKIAENAKSITVLEDSSVEKGGAIIESDFGEVDARISSQLREIEGKILDLVPIRSTEER